MTGGRKASFRILWDDVTTVLNNGRVVRRTYPVRLWAAQGRDHPEPLARDGARLDVVPITCPIEDGALVLVRLVHGELDNVLAEVRSRWEVDDAALGEEPDRPQVQRVLGDAMKVLYELASRDAP